MKRKIESEIETIDWVAPRTGAWIETLSSGYLVVPALVAPRTGAWIETSYQCRPLQSSAVAPRTGAWIETNDDVFLVGLILGRPSHRGVD